MSLNPEKMAQEAMKAEQSADNWKQYATEREETAQQVAEENRWQEFAREHGCRLIAKKAKQVQPGSQTEISPARTVYQCDDVANYER
jgi:hypothetical protein